MFFNKSKFFYIFFFILIFLITFCYSMFFTESISDEIWNYGFSYNISSGLIPYRDFNMIVTPLFSIFGSVFIKIFGNYLFSIHIFGAIFIAITVVLLFKMIGYKSLICYIYILFYYFPSYNYFALFFLFLVLYLIFNNKDNDILISIIVSLAFLSKQTIGLCMLIPCLYYSRNKLKSFISFFIPVCLFCIYLIFNDALFEFFDYCFLGMFSFSNKNFYYLFLIPEVIVLIYLFRNLLKCNFKDKQCFYILMFQIMSFPIVDISHFLIAIIPVVYYVLSKNNVVKSGFNRLLYISTFGISFLIFGLNLDFSIVDDDNFMKFRNANLELMELSEQVSIIENYKNDYDNDFFILDTAYLFKLYMNESINKFDILNNGNFGYRGSSGYIDDINEICLDNSCVFFVAYWYYDEVEGQLNEEIFDYITNNYILIDEYKYFHIYANV